LNTLINILSALGDYFRMIALVIWEAFKNPPHFKLIRNQMYEIGVLSLPVVAVTGFSTGMVLAAQSFFQLADKGLASATGLMVTKGSRFNSLHGDWTCRGRDVRGTRDNEGH